MPFAAVEFPFKSAGYFFDPFTGTRHIFRGRIDAASDTANGLKNIMNSNIC